MSRFAAAVRSNFRVNEGYTLNVLDHQLAKDGVSWRLDVHSKGWVYLEWKGRSMVASSTVALSDDELLGFFKAKFPELNIRGELVDAAIKRLQGVIADFEKERA